MDSVIYSTTIYLRACCVSGSFLSTEDTIINITDRVLTFLGLRVMKKVIREIHKSREITTKICATKERCMALWEQMKGDLIQSGESPF